MSPWITDYTTLVPLVARQILIQNSNGTNYSRLDLSVSPHYRNQTSPVHWSARRHHESNYSSQLGMICIHYSNLHLASSVKCGMNMVSSIQKQRFVTSVWHGTSQMLTCAYLTPGRVNTPHWPCSRLCLTLLLKCKLWTSAGKVRGSATVWSLCPCCTESESHSHLTPGGFSLLDLNWNDS